MNNNQVLVANVAGTYYAMDAVCSHMNGYLSAGKLHNNVVTCPVHHAQYDVTTGKIHKNVAVLFRLPTKGKGATSVNSYQVVVEGDEIKITL